MNIKPHGLEMGLRYWQLPITHLRDLAFATLLKICPNLVAVNLKKLSLYSSVETLTLAVSACKIQSTQGIE